MTRPTAGTLHGVLHQTLDAFAHVAADIHPNPAPLEFGEVTFVGPGIVRASGLKTVQSEELVRVGRSGYGVVLNLEPDEVGIVLLDSQADLSVGTEVLPTRRVLDVPVGHGLIGRVVDAIGRPLDGRGPVAHEERLPVERDAPGIMDRAPVTVPLQTGIKVIDALIPIGRGQRELILGDRQTGKTAIALDTIVHQHDQNVLCVYCAIGQRGTSVARALENLRHHDAMRHTIAVVAMGEDRPGLQYFCPYAAMTIAEWFMAQGRDVLVVFDDLTRHALAYRELSLLLRRPPGREAFPGDIFYIHSRLLERSTHLRKELGGGSVTALPIAETEAQNLSAYIPTNLISITDGQIYLSPRLFQRGLLPAVDVGRSVSRVGGRTQLPAYRSVSGNLRLAYSQFEELETFARFGTRLDEETRATLAHGRVVREILRQPEFHPLSAAEQIAVLTAVSEGLLDDQAPARIPEIEDRIRTRLNDTAPDLARRILDGTPLDDSERRTLLQIGRDALPTP